MVNGAECGLQYRKGDHTKQYIPCRIAALQDKLRERGLDAALIYDRENLIYFAGISDLEGGVL